MSLRVDLSVLLSRKSLECCLEHPLCIGYRDSVSSDSRMVAQSSL